jgi:hypothetical protein
MTKPVRRPVMAWSTGKLITFRPQWLPLHHGTQQWAILPAKPYLENIN